MVYVTTDIYFDRFDHVLFKRVPNERFNLSNCYYGKSFGDKK